MSEEEKRAGGEGKSVIAAVSSQRHHWPPDPVRHCWLGRLATPPYLKLCFRRSWLSLESLMSSNVLLIGGGFSSDVLSCSTSGGVPSLKVNGTTLAANIYLSSSPVTEIEGVCSNIYLS